MCLAIPGEIIGICGDEPMTRTARASFGGAVREISLALLPEARVGDYVLVHAGFAIGLIDETEARQVFDYLGQMEQADAPGDVPHEIS